jgi:hypothetical protein
LDCPANAATPNTMHNAVPMRNPRMVVTSCEDFYLMGVSRRKRFTEKKVFTFR